MAKLLRIKYCILIVVSLLIFNIPLVSSLRVHADIYSPEGIVVGATYYGGRYENGWVIDNKNQCDRIAKGEFTAESLDARVDAICDDDNGIGFDDNDLLHNTVSFAELSNNPEASDFSALGNLPFRTKVEIKYKDRCVIAEKLDVGQGGEDVNDYKRAIDLWWQTARSLGFTNGFDIMTVRYVPGSTPLTPLGKSIECASSDLTAEAPTPKNKDLPSPSQEPPTTALTPIEIHPVKPSISMPSSEKEALEEQVENSEGVTLGLEEESLGGQVNYLEDTQGSKKNILLVLSIPITIFMIIAIRLAVGYLSKKYKFYKRSSLRSK